MDRGGARGIAVVGGRGGVPCGHHVGVVDQLQERLHPAALLNLKSTSATAAHSVSSRRRAGGSSIRRCLTLEALIFLVTLRGALRTPATMA
jgi:hypothetical protein